MCLCVCSIRDYVQSVQDLHSSRNSQRKFQQTSDNLKVKTLQSCCMMRTQTFMHTDDSHIEDENRTIRQLTHVI